MDNLTYREKQVLKYLLEGCTNKEIGSRLFIHHETVKKCLSEIYLKTGCSGRVKLIIFAQRNFHLKPV